MIFIEVNYLHIGILARLKNQLGKTNGSKSYYENALKILTFDNYEKGEDIKQIITKEMNNQNVKKYPKPITSLREIV